MKYGLLLAASAFALAATSAALTIGSAETHAKNVNIKLSYWVPPRHKLTPGYKEWGESVKKASGGTITTTLFPSSQLGSGRDHYDMVKRGIASFGLINPGYTPGRFPILGASDLPFTIRDSLAGAKALTRWYKKYAAKEMKDHYVRHIFTHDKATFHTTKKQVRVPADVKGMNIRSANQTMSRFVTALGGNPVQVPIMEAKDTLSKGITDGITVTFGGLTGTFKFKDVIKYSLDVPLYVSTFEHGLTKRVYNGMDASQRRVIDNHCTPEWSAKVYRYWYEADQKDQKTGRNIPGHTWTKVNASQLAQWKAAAAPVVAQWKASVKKVGQDPDQVLKEMNAELKKENAQF
ncbi:MAG: TRAP transporter substrate-binding protein [Rhodospirillales bacterium]|jgi:TRAP-type C4-dicarboxylate transport system substrate-binding protein|nr:C4-dicarboxylate ABC transporter [Rhodospirillaceae bacterium]MDP6427311.1 TRAP transporter substrate-binding protein [Rhodospirillales bacterium]MDP6645091.1 TRAP transporter substrate-binding protein [Rhodospirillales bacterium]MDP6841607.1 TRAP transporter substrate-binding protein [Rhodospirillales bacterium]|tara:strand:+ start:471 stop:1514 length:1044 start_codon:yes stop_codon:yes gene_type:complete